LMIPLRSRYAPIRLCSWPSWLATGDRSPFVFAFAPDYEGQVDECGLMILGGDEDVPVESYRLKAKPDEAAESEGWLKVC